MKDDFRLEKDSIGTIEVPKNALWGAQTQRSIKNFALGDELIPLELIYAITLIKKAAAIANNNLGYLDNKKKDLIKKLTTERLARQNLTKVIQIMFQSIMIESISLDINNKMS